MRIGALVTAWSEERFIAGCLGHLLVQGMKVYFRAKDSTHRTVTSG